MGEQLLSALVMGATGAVGCIFTQEKDKPDIGGFSMEGLLFSLELSILCSEIYELCGQTRFWSVTNQSQHSLGVWDSNRPTLASTAEILQAV